MDIVRTLGVAIDANAAKTGGAAASTAFKDVGGAAKDMEAKVTGAGNELGKTGEQMKTTSRAGDLLRETLNRNTVVLGQVEQAITQLTSKLNVERVSVAASTAEHSKATAAMSRTSQEARNLGTAVDVEAKKMRDSAKAVADSGAAHARAAEQARDASGKFTNGADGSSKSALNLSGMLGYLKTAAAAFGITLSAVGLVSFTADLVRTEMQAQRTANALRYASASQQDFERNQSFAASTANTLGLDQVSSTREFAKFMAAGKGTQFTGDQLREVYLSVSKAATVLSLSSDETAGALNALQQMISKGTVQAEELRGQLGERLPGAFNLAARSMGVTTAQLGKMLDNGELTAYQLLPALAKELDKSFGPETQKAAASLNAEINRLGNSITTAKTNLTGGIFADILTAGSKGASWSIKIISDPVSLRILNALNGARKNGALGEIFGLGISQPTTEFAAANSPNAAFSEQNAYRAAMRASQKVKDAAEDPMSDPKKARQDLIGQIEQGDALYKVYNQQNYEQMKVREAQAKASIDLEWDVAVQKRKALEKQIQDGNELYMKAQAQRTAFIQKYNKPVVGGNGFSAGIDSYIRQQNGTAGIREAGKEAGITDEQIAKIEGATIRMERLRNIGTGTAQAIENGFSNFTDSMIDGTKSIGEAFTSMTAGILRDIAQIVARQMIAAPIAGALSSLIGGVAGSYFNFGGGAAAGASASSGSFNSSLGAAPTANIYHTGGVVGVSSAISRQVSPGLFHNAPRFHNGLKHDEFPAILQKGETVIPKGGSGDATPVISMPINITVNGSDGGSSDKDRAFGAEVARQVEGMVDQRIAMALRPQSLMRRSGR